MVQMLLLVDVDKCVGCLQCENVCSLKHEGECIPARSSIKILRREMMGADGYFVAIPVVCQQCEIPMCKEVCPTNAIFQDLETGAYLVNEDKCVGCRLCTISCPLGAIEVHPDKNTAIKCDLCGGEPLCAKICLAGAISYVQVDKIGFQARRKAVKRLSELLELIRPTLSVR